MSTGVQIWSLTCCYPTAQSKLVQGRPERLLAEAD
jgi:hypothetical protein